MRPLNLVELVHLLQSPTKIRFDSHSGLTVHPQRCEELLKDPHFRIRGVAIDSRHVKNDFLFAALKGENCHGLDHAGSAFDSGACLLMSEKGKAADHPLPVLEVDDVQQALVHLATSLQSSEFDPPKTVAVTGSVGKTTTCHLGAQLSKGTYSVHSPRGSFNNFLGLPVTILEAPEETDLLWLELGTNQPGEISALAQISQPHVAIVTAVGATHLEGLGSVEGVLREKFSIFDSKVAELAIAPVDFREETIPVPCWWTGPGGDVVVTADKDVNGMWRVEHRPLGYSFEVRTNLKGQGSLRCFESAVAALLHLGVSPERIQELAPTVGLPRLRQEEHSVAGVDLVLDCYNASPPSMISALTDLKESAAKSRVAVLGTMEELGSDEVKYHREVGRFCSEQGIDHVFCCGRGAAWLAEGVADGGGSAQILSQGAIDTAALEEVLDSGSRVLFKASRKVELEKFAIVLKEKLVQREMELGERGVVS
ncbi:MAG: hypothetical protein CBC13_05365 [Planctomycetia bacterium TMED53]|nr:MAG: hypothetical protein CBC13_05365 [Planctomycetia bacterium TMED53]